MPLKFEFLFDFGSPNAYLAELVLPEIERRKNENANFESLPNDAAGFSLPCMSPLGGAGGCRRWSRPEAARRGLKRSNP
jgi:hypothetical protein